MSNITLYFPIVAYGHLPRQHTKYRPSNTIQHPRDQQLNTNYNIRFSAAAAEKKSSSPNRTFELVMLNVTKRLLSKHRNSLQFPSESLSIPHSRPRLSPFNAKCTVNSQWIEEGNKSSTLAASFQLRHRGHPSKIHQTDSNNNLWNAQRRSSYQIKVHMYQIISVLPFFFSSRIPPIAHHTH